MKPFTATTFTGFLRECGSLFMQGLDAVLAMPWPQRLAVCIAAALLLAVLPMALMLFALLFLVKVLFGAALFARRAAPKALPHEAAAGKGEQA